MTPEKPVDRNAVHAEVRKAIDALVKLGSLEALPPGDLARVGAAARTFTRTVAAIARRRAGDRPAQPAVRRAEGTAPPVLAQPPAPQQRRTR